MRPLNPALCPSLLVKYDKSAGTRFKGVIIAVGLFVLFCFVLFFSLESKGGQTQGIMLQGHNTATCCIDKNVCSAHWGDMWQGRIAGIFCPRDMSHNSSR